LDGFALQECDDCSCGVSEDDAFNEDIIEGVGSTTIASFGHEGFGATKTRRLPNLHGKSNRLTSVADMCMKICTKLRWVLVLVGRLDIIGSQSVC
jgi:hypothetical protein